MRQNFSESIEYFIRKSFIGKNLFRLRKFSPGFYNTVRQFYSFIFKIKSKNNLARYQIRAVHRFFEFVPKGVLASPVLEIGSDVDARVIREMHELGCLQVTGVNPVFSQGDLDKYNPSLPGGCILKNVDMRSTGFEDKSFGSIFSVSVFEHLLDFEYCLGEMHRILMPGGMVYADFGPIWSSSLGHHVYANAGNEIARHWDPRLNPLDDFSHLLLSKYEMKQSLVNRVSSPLRDEILEWVYAGVDINRLFFEDFLKMIKSSPFEIISMEKDEESVPEKALINLREKYQGYNIFNVRNVELVLKKSDK